MAILVRIHISQIIPKITFPYIITFNSTDRDRCQLTANILVMDLKNSWKGDIVN